MAYSETAAPFVLSANVPACYSAAHFFCGIPIVSSVHIASIAKGLLEDKCRCCDCTVTIYGAVRGEVFIKHEARIDRFRLSDYLLGGSDSALFDLSDYKILPDADFVSGLSAPFSTTVTVSVSIGDRGVSRSYGIRLLPFGYLSPEMPPELYAAYVMPGCGLGLRTADTYAGEKARLTKDTPFYRAELCASVMQKANLTFSPLLPELPLGECVIRDYDSVAVSNNRSMSLTEATLLYCSMAESIGLSPIAIFLRRDTNAVKGYIGINLSNDTCPAVCESLPEIRDRILAKKMFVFDVLGLLGTEATDFARNVSETTASILRQSASTAVAVDILAARSLGVRSIRPADKKTKVVSRHKYSDVSEVLRRIDEIGRQRTVFGFSPYSSRALGICAKANSLEFGKVYTALAIDEEVLCTDPDSFSHISTFKPENVSEHPRNMTEKAAYDAKIKKLFSRIEAERSSGGLYMYSSGGFLSGKKLSGKIVRDDFNAEIAFLVDSARNKLLSDGHVEVYAAAGIVTFLRDGKEIFAPCAYVPCRLSASEESVTLRYGTDRAILNTALSDETEGILGRFDYKDKSVSGKAERQSELSAILSHYAQLSNYDSEFVYHPDTYLSVFDLSYTLMRGCIESTDGKKFEGTLLEGSYTPSESFDTHEHTVLPFDVPSVFSEAVKRACTDSIIISGPRGSGKKAACASIATENHNFGNDTLILSGYSETLESVSATLKSAGLSELSVILRDDESTRAQILSDIRLLMQTPDAPEYIEGEVSEYTERLDAYAQSLHAERCFGYSLYECIDEYCRCLEKIDDAALEVSIHPQELSPSALEELLEVSKGLCTETRRLADSVVGTTVHELCLDSFNISEPPSRGLRELLSSASEELTLFAEKSAAARHYLGIPKDALCDVRSLRAFGEFLESVVFSGVDFMPERLLGGGIYSNAKKVEKVCSVIDELKTFKGRFDDISDDISEISCTNLYLRHQRGETNPFIRASVMHEVKKYVPSTKKLTYPEAGELLCGLSRHETLQKELSRLTPECSVILGGLWKGVSTDTETARRSARFAILLESCSAKMSRGERNGVDLRSGIASLISALKCEGEIRAELLLSTGAFRKLCGKGGLLERISAGLGCDLYEFSFTSGILSDNGLSGLFERLSRNLEVLGLLPNYNSLKKRAALLGISSFVAYAKENNGDDGCMQLFKKSIFSALARSVIDSDPDLRGINSETIEEYIALCRSERASLIHRIISEHRDSFASYISTTEGKNELKALCTELQSPSYTVFELFTRHRSILRTMYSIILAHTFDAYRFDSYPDSLILFDCNKTDAAEAIPLCAHFDRCVFVSDGNERLGSIMKLLPRGIPEFSSNYVMSYKNGSVLSLCKCFSKRLDFTEAHTFSDIYFIKCEGGMYDRALRSNRIEALTTCEAALAASKKYGFDKVGIIAFTASQAAEIMQILGVLSAKHANPLISTIPVRYIGKAGDFSKEVIVLSATFGKNVYSVTRSFGILDEYAKRNGVSESDGIAAIIEELLSCGEKLYVVSSVEPLDILTDTLGGGARVFASLLSFARYGVIPKKPSSSPHRLCGGIERTLGFGLCEDASEKITVKDGVIRCRNKAIIYNDTPDIPCFDRVVLRYDEYTKRGCEVRFLPTAELLNQDSGNRI